MCQRIKVDLIEKSSKGVNLLAAIIPAVGGALLIAGSVVGVIMLRVRHVVNTFVHIVNPFVHVLVDFVTLPMIEQMDSQHEQE